MRRFFKISFSLLIYVELLLLMTACARRAPDPSVMNMLKDSGDNALLTVIIQPKHWNESTKTIMALAKVDKTKTLAKMAQARDVFSAFLLALDNKQQNTKIDESMQLKGLDSSKPVVASLFQPVPGDVAIAVRTMLIPTMKQIQIKGIPGIRHTIFIGASNVSKLIKELGDIIHAHGFGDMLKQQDKTRKPVFFQWREAGYFIALIPEKNRVRIEIVQDELLPGQNADKRISTLLQDIIKPHPKSKSTFNSPAWGMATQDKHLLVFHVRPWVLRDLSAQVGAFQIAQALSSVDPSMKATLLAVGMSEVANGFLLMSRQLAETEDIALGVDLQAGLRISYVAGLSEYGKKLYDAGLSKEPFSLRPQSKDAVLSAWNKIDMANIIKSAKPLPMFSEAKNLNEAMSAIQEGGFFCNLHFIWSSPIGITRTVLSLLPQGISQKIPDRIPKGFAITLSSFDPKIPYGGLQACAAIGYEKGADISWIQAALMSLGLGEKVQFSTDSIEGGQIVQLGMGMDASKEFSKDSREDDTGQFAGASVNIPRLLQVFSATEPGLSEIFGQLGQLRMKAWIRDRAALGEILLPLQRGQKMSAMKWMDTAIYGGSKWTSLAPSGKQTKGQECMARVTKKMIKAFRALAYAASGEKGVLLGKALLELDEPIGCAMEQPDTKAQATKLRAIVTMYAADRMEENFDRQAALAVLGKGCKQGIEAACVRLEKMASEPEIHLARLEAKGLDVPAWGQSFIKISADGKVSSYTEQNDSSRVAIAVDKDTPWKALWPVMKAAKKVDLLVRASGINTIMTTPSSASIPLPDDSQSVAIKIQQKALLISSNGSEETLEDIKRCKDEAACIDMNKLVNRLQDLRGYPGNKMRVFIEPRDETKFLRIAQVLAAVEDETKTNRLAYGSGTTTLGPLPKDVLLKIKESPVQPEHPGSSGILGILGTKSNKVSGLGSLKDMDALGTFGHSAEAHSKGKKAHKATIRMASGKVRMSGPMSKEVIRRIIRRANARFRYCYERELLNDAKLSGKVLVKFTIGKNGLVQTASVVQTSLKNKSVEKCLLNRVKALMFPKPLGGGIVVVSYPFLFNTD